MQDAAARVAVIPVKVTYFAVRIVDEYQRL
jgi:hypothetical protein